MGIINISCLSEGKFMRQSHEQHMGCTAIALTFTRKKVVKRKTVKKEVYACAYMVR